MPHRIPLVPLTAASFAPFGTAIQTPPASAGVPANQGTAVKHAPISPLASTYAQSTAAAAAAPLLSLFSCSPRALSAGGVLALHVLERHPYTTQTFSPLGLDARDARAAYVVVVAPAGAGGGPDARAARAFLCRGDQAVTYGAGTWHAPMAVVGDRPVSFLVAQFANGVAADDCVEWHAPPGHEIEVAVDLARLAAAGSKL